MSVNRPMRGRNILTKIVTFGSSCHFCHANGQLMPTMKRNILLRTVGTGIAYLLTNILKSLFNKSVKRIYRLFVVTVILCLTSHELPI